MSQKINPNSLRLGVQKSWESVWFSDPTKRKQTYTKLLHEDLVIQNYLKGFFWMFDLYQSQCQIERKPNGSVQVNVHLYKHQKNLTLTPKEKVLKEGLNLGWVPFIISKTLGILFSKSNTVFSKKESSKLISNLTLLNLELVNSWIEKQKPSNNIWSFLQNWPNTRLSQHSFKSEDKHGQLKLKTSSTSNYITDQTKNSYLSESKSAIPQKNSLLKKNILNSLLTTQDTSKAKYDTEINRFEKDWVSFLETKNSLNQESFLEIKNLENSPKGNKFDSSENNWWSKRQWESQVFLNSAYKTKKISLNIIPVRTMLEDPRLIADYLATKIEISTPIQTVFNEIIRMFEKEVQCIGPDFEVGSSIKNLESKDSAGSTASVLYPDIIVEGFKLQCTGRIQVYPRSKPAEKAETIQISRGSLPLNTIYENIQYVQTHATNDYGTCGIKVWVNYATK